MPSATARSDVPAAPKPRRSRDPERTRQRIFQAALREFVSKGFAGARVDSIARAADVNKRLLYHYYGNKTELFRSVVTAKVAEKTQAILREPEDPAALLPYWFDLNAQDQDWLRLLSWEALQLGEPIVETESRRRQFQEAIDSLSGSQRHGLLRAGLPLEETLLLGLAMTVYPFAFPQYVRLITGLQPRSKEFQKRWTAFLRALGEILREASAAAAPALPEVDQADSATG